MSESGDSHIQGEDTQGHQIPMENTGPLVAVHVENFQVSETQDNDDDEPEPGDQNNDRRRLNRRVDSAMCDPTMTRRNLTIDGLLLEDTTRRNKPLTGPRRMNTAPVNRPNTETQQLLLPAPVSTVQGRAAASENRIIEVENSCVCGVFECKSTDTLWLEGGSLRRMNEGEEIVVEKASRFGDCFRMISLLSFVLVTNKRFVVKQLLKIGPFNVQTQEASHHFANLEHVTVERGIFTRKNRNKLLIFSGLTLFAILFLQIESLFFPFLGTILFLLAILYGICSVVIFLILYCVSFLVIDVAKTNIIGSWSWGFLSRGRSYLTLRVPLSIQACFEVMNALIERHPLLPKQEDDV